jgi:dTDP-4-dehydrorhamnose 3,5-epimerase-like enzyme
MQSIRVDPLEESTDERGLSFSLLQRHLAAVGPVQHVHIATIRPGHVRGNHYHSRHREMIAVVYSDSWSLYWDTGPGTQVQNSRFTGSGAVVVFPPLNWAHAVRNDGDLDVLIVAASDAPYDGPSGSRARADAKPRRLTG